MAADLGSTLVIASHNQGKLDEFREILRDLPVKVESCKTLNLSEPEETGVTFVENARLKAVSAVEESGLLALSDDSGVAVSALNGDPGIYSARWAGPTRDFALAMQKVQDALTKSGSKDRSAKFVCQLCLRWPDGREELFLGETQGQLVWPPRGDHGFGYDPMFVPDGEPKGRTFGEMTSAEKARFSHRNKAVDAFKAWLNGDG